MLDATDICMSLSFEDLLRLETYPPMCHPSANPAVVAAVAREAGLLAQNPAEGHILEIGCGTGHHLLSLASRWPQASFEGLDHSARAIRRARALAKRAGLSNVRFIEASLLDFQPDASYDQIIAHGFFSWVPDEVKVSLMPFLKNNLSAEGVATVSFNVAAGWKARMRVVEKVRAIQEAGNIDEMAALNIVQTVADDSKEAAIIADMMAKGPAVLAYDDFAPIMDAWSLGAVLKLARESGLAWLGDSVTGGKGSDKKDDTKERTFRSELFYREDAVLSEGACDARQSYSADRVPDFPKLNPWRMLCVMEGLPVPDRDFKPCQFTVAQLLVMAAMDGKHTHFHLASYAKENAPDLNIVAFLKHLAERGIFEKA